MWFWLSLAALLCWSGSDLFSKLGSRPEDKTSHWKMVMAVGLVMGLHAGYAVAFGGVAISWTVIWRYLPASLLYIGSMAMGYAGLRYIELSVSSPICNSSGAVVFLAMCLLMPAQVDIPPPMVAAVVMICVGVTALGFVEMREDEALKFRRRERANVRYARSFLALLFPLLYCLLDAAGTFADIRIMYALSGGDEALQETVAMQCNTAYELTFFALGLAAAVYVLGIRRERLSVRREGPKLIAGVCEAAGQMAYAYVMADTRYAAYGAAVIASYCAVSALWGRLFLKERLSPKHYAAIAVTVAGIVLMGLLGA